MFIKGQRIVIINGTFVSGIEGTVTHTEMYKGENRVWAIWDDDGIKSWVRLSQVKLASKFRAGDIINIGKNIITIDGTQKFNEKRAVLIARKQLI